MLMLFWQEGFHCCFMPSGTASRTLLATVGPALPLVSSCCRQLEAWNALQTLNILRPRTAGRSESPLLRVPLLTPLLACSEY